MFPRPCRRTRRIALSLALLAAPTLALQEAPPPAETPHRVLQLALEDALRLALRNNFDLEIERLSSEVASYDAQASWGAFDPVLNLQGTAAESESDQFRENINAMVQDLSEQPMTMAEYTKLTTDWVKKSNGVLQLEREIEFAGHPATEVAYTIPANATGMDIEVMFHQVWLLKYNKAYLLTYAAQPHSYEKFELEAAEIFKSFVLKAK